MTDHHSHTQTDSRDEAVSELKAKKSEIKRLRMITLANGYQVVTTLGRGARTAGKGTGPAHGMELIRTHFMREFLPLMKLLSEVNNKNKMNI